MAIQLGRVGAGCLPEFIVTSTVTANASCAAGGGSTYALTVPSYAVNVDHRAMGAIEPIAPYFRNTLHSYRVEKKGYVMENGEYDDNVSTADMANGISYYFVAPNGRRVANGIIDSNHSCCYATNPDFTYNSEGVDFDATGEVLKGWQLSASYNFDRTKQKGSNWGVNEGLPILSPA